MPRGVYQRKKRKTGLEALFDAKTENDVPNPNTFAPPENMFDYIDWKLKTFEMPEMSKCNNANYDLISITNGLVTKLKSDVLMDVERMAILLERYGENAEVCWNFIEAFKDLVNEVLTTQQNFRYKQDYDQQLMTARALIQQEWEKEHKEVCQQCGHEQYGEY